PNGCLTARVARSVDPLLYLEHDRRDPNVNRAGYRGAEFALEERPNRFRIAVLGHSLGYGYSVRPSETLPVLLEDAPNREGRAPLRSRPGRRALPCRERRARSSEPLRSNHAESSGSRGAGG